MGCPTTGASADSTCPRGGASRRVCFLPLGWVRGRFLGLLAPPTPLAPLTSLTPLTRLSYCRDGPRPNPIRSPRRLPRRLALLRPPPPRPHRRRILGLDPKALVTRRWYYFIPAPGEPRKLVHRIERAASTRSPARKPATPVGRSSPPARPSSARTRTHRHAILSQQRHHVCLHGRRRHRRIPPLPRQRDRHLRRSRRPV